MSEQQTTAYVLVYDPDPDNPWVEPQADMDEGVFLDRDKAQARADEINRREYEVECAEHERKVRHNVDVVAKAQQRWDVLEAAGLADGPRPSDLATTKAWQSFEEWLRYKRDPYTVAEIALHGMEAS